MSFEQRTTNNEQRTTNEPEAVQAGLQISKFSLGVNLLLAILKTAAGFWGHSNALVADGIESIADVFSSLIVWGGLRFSIKPADPGHPYGHGKAEPIASLIVSVMLLAAAALIAVRSVIELQALSQEPPKWFTLPVLFGVIAIKEILYRRTLRMGRDLESTALQTDAWHHRSDALTSAAAAVGITVALLGGPGFEKADDWAALAACLVIVWNGLRLARAALDEVMDASVSPEILNQVKALSTSVNGVVAVEKCRIRKIGLHLAVDIHVVVDGSITVRRGHDISHEVKDRLLVSPLRVNDVIVHIEPDGQTSMGGGTLLFALISLAIPSLAAEPAWPRHTIDQSSRGADGVRCADVNADGHADIVTGWEEGGVVRVYINPGPAQATQPWPQVAAGPASSVEDAVLVDLDGNGTFDVVSSCEGDTRSLFVHWAPPQKDYLRADAWKTEAIPCSVRKMQWMFALPLQIDGRQGIDLFAGGKNTDAQIGWLESPAHPRQLADWKWHPLRPVGWLMSLIPSDMDGDGDVDVVFTDRKGPRRGCYWLELPDDPAGRFGNWTEHLIDGTDHEVMFATVADLDGDALKDIVVATHDRELLFLRRTDSTGRTWNTHVIKAPSSSGGPKAVAVGDIDLDGRADLAFTCEGAERKSGVMWLAWSNAPTDSQWIAHDISGHDGVKHDLLELLDLDGDGDLDVLTCEEKKNLGVFWYENPTKAAKP